MKVKYARQIRQGIQQARRPEAKRRALTDLEYKAFRRESNKRLGRLMQRLSALQLKSEVSAIMYESAEVILNEWITERDQP